MQRDERLSCMDKINSEDDQWSPFLSVIQIDFSKLDLSFFCTPPEGVSVCVSSCIQPTLCPARVVLCLAATQICSECLVYIPKTERLFTLDTWPEPSVGVWPQSKKGFHSEASIYLSRNDRLAASMPYLVTFSPLHLFFYTFVHLSLFLSSSTLSVSAPEGFHLHSTCPDSCTAHHFMHRSIVTD